jgi:hypothetical protein
MTQYELQIKRNQKYADRTQVLIQTPRLLMFVVDGKIVYTHEYNEEGKCISATWHTLK